MISSAKYPTEKHNGDWGWRHYLFTSKAGFFYKFGHWVKFTLDYLTKKKN